MPIPFQIYFGACASLTDLELKFTNALFCFLLLFCFDTYTTLSIWCRSSYGTCLTFPPETKPAETLVFGAIQENTHGTQAT